jgi:hypothetical protein
MSSGKASKRGRRHEPGLRDAQSRLRPLPRRCGVNGERMDAARKLACECVVDHAMSLQPALSAKGFGHDIDSIMCFSAPAVAGVACVLVRLVLDMQAFRGESFVQFFCDEIASLHDRQP